MVPVPVSRARSEATAAISRTPVSAPSQPKWAPVTPPSNETSHCPGKADDRSQSRFLGLPGHRRERTRSGTILYPPIQRSRHEPPSVRSRQGRIIQLSRPFPGRLRNFAEKFSCLGVELYCPISLGGGEFSGCDVVFSHFSGSTGSPCARGFRGAVHLPASQSSDSIVGVVWGHCADIYGG